MSNKFNEILSFLKELGLENVTKGEKKALYKNFEKEHNVRKLKGELDLLFAINQSLIKSYSKVSVTNMLDIYKNIDAKLMFNLSTMYELARVKCKNELAALKSFKGVVLQTLQANEKVNQEVAKMFDKTMKKSLALKDSLYLTMHSIEQADALFDNCVNRSKLFIRNCESNNLEAIIYCLKKDFSFSDEELVDISKKCASFFVASSVSKINNLHKQIEDFKKYIKNQSAVMSAAKEIDKLLDKDFKAVLSDASSVATLNPSQVNRTIRFLSGEKLGGIVFVNSKIGEIKGDFTPFQLAKIYNQSISSLSISVEKIADVCANIDEVYKKVFDKELDFSKFINGNNFNSIDQLTKEDYLKNEKISEIFEILSMFLTAQDMENLLRNNMSFLIAPVDAVKKSLQSAVLMSENKDELRKHVLQKIRNHFDIYESGFKYSAMEEKSMIKSSLNKVGVRDMEESEIKNILENLNTDTQNIEKWEKKWNKEEKEYRDLSIQIDLEKLIEKTERVKEFANVNFDSIEQFEEEIDIVKDMLEEIDNEYKMIVEANKLNKHLMGIANNAHQKIEQVKERINYNIDIAISTYNEELEALNEQLLNWKDSLDKVSRKNREMEKLDKLIVDKQISKESNEEKASLLKDIKRFMDDSNKEVTVIENKEKEISKKINEYFLFLEAEYKEQILNKDIPFVDAEMGNLLGLKGKFYGFINALEAENLIEGIELPYYSSSIKNSYKQYRNSINEKERKLVDEIYNMCVTNIKAKEALKVSMLESLSKFGLDYEEKLKIYEKFELLAEFSVELERTIKENKKILKEREQYNKEEIISKINSLEEGKSDIEKSISECSKKIGELLKKQIKR